MLLNMDAVEDIDRKELKELLLDKEALKTNDVVVVAEVRGPFLGGGTDV